jgi:NMD protein affecting ribosome stability and mRNA decay
METTLNNKYMQQLHNDKCLKCGNPPEFGGALCNTCLKEGLVKYYESIKAEIKLSNDESDENITIK